MYISNVNSASIHLKSIQPEKFDTKETIVQSGEFLTLLYITKGAATIKIQDAVSDVKKHDLLIINPEQTAQISFLRKTDWIQLTIEGIVFTSSFDIDQQTNFFVVHDEDSRIIQYISIAHSEQKHYTKGADLILRKLTECIIVHILRNRGLSIKDANKQVKHDEISKLQDYIRQHYTKKLTLDELSEQANINKYYLIRLFKQQTGLSPIDYLIHVRLSEAEKLLANSTMSITDIADLVGFHSPSHFSKTFKETNHITPSKYRQKHRQKV